MMKLDKLESWRISFIVLLAVSMLSFSFMLAIIIDKQAVIDKLFEQVDDKQTIIEVQRGRIDNLQDDCILLSDMLYECETDTLNINR